jgi:hypothetical protein
MSPEQVTSPKVSRHPQMKPGSKRKSSLWKISFWKAPHLAEGIMGTSYQLLGIYRLLLITLLNHL